MRVYVDDNRVPECTHNWDVIARNFYAARFLILTGKVTNISLDWELQPGDAGTGMELAELILKGAQDGTIPRMGWYVHTGHSGWGKKMRQVLHEADKAWYKREKKNDSNSSG